MLTGSESLFGSDWSTTPSSSSKKQILSRARHWAPVLFFEQEANPFSSHWFRDGVGSVGSSAGKQQHVTFRQALHLSLEMIFWRLAAPLAFVVSDGKEHEPPLPDGWVTWLLTMDWTSIASIMNGNALERECGYNVGLYPQLSNSLNLLILFLFGASINRCLNSSLLCGRYKNGIPRAAHVLQFSGSFYYLLS